jgi:integrase/recombinase XerD
MLQDVVDAYLTALSERSAGNNRHTVAAYRNDLSQFAAFLERQRSRQCWSQVALEDLDAYLHEMREVRAYRPATIARKLAALKAFFRYLSVLGLLEQSPIEHLRAPRSPRGSSPALSGEQIGKLIQQISLMTPTGQRDLAMLHVLYATGMHLTDLVALEVGSFDRPRSSLCCRRADGQVREFFLAPPATLILERYLCRARPYLARRHPEESALFLNHHGRRLTRQGFWLVIRGYAQRAGIGEITPYVLRHSLMVLAIQESEALRNVHELLENAHVSTARSARRRAAASSQR